MNSKGTPESAKRLAIPIDNMNGWTKETIEECSTLIENLSPDEVISGLKAAVSLHSSIGEKNIGRPKAYRAAWIKLQNNLISLEEFETTVHLQLINNEIKKDTYYRAIRNAKKFIEHNNRAKKISKMQSYEEIWMGFQSNHINWSEFKTYLAELKQKNRISDTKYNHALVEGEKLLKIRKVMIDIQNNK